MHRILLIDDDELLREVMARCLAQAGYCVEQAANGREGIARMRANMADLVITDLVMPEMEGIETITKLHRDFPGLPVIAMSGAAKRSPSYLMLAKKLGAIDTLLKPFSPDELLCRVSIRLEGRENPPSS